MTVRIKGTGSCLPKTVITNDYLAGIMETSDEWISSRTGIKERRLVKDETTTYLSAQAAQEALRDSGVSAEELDLLLVATITGDYTTPSTACMVQAEIGAHNAVAFDIQGACAGFMFALHTAYAYMQSGIYKKVLVVGAETLSKIMDWQDRSTCVLFGDGAGAIVLECSESGILAFDQGSDGARGKVLTCLGRGKHNPLVDESQEIGYVQMDGQEVYKFAVSTVPASIQKVLGQAQVTPEEIDYYLLHQANLRILQAVAKRLKVSEDKFPICLDHCGNMSAASVPVLLDEVNKKGLLKRGQKLILSGFGAGLTWGTALLEW